MMMSCGIITTIIVIILKCIDQNITDMKVLQGILHSRGYKHNGMLVLF